MKQGHIRFNGVGDLYDVSGPIVTTLCSLVQIKLAAVHKDLAINNFESKNVCHTVTSCYDVFCFPNYQKLCESCAKFDIKIFFRHMGWRQSIRTYLPSSSRILNYEFWTKIGSLRS